jgi:hypothetical protein
MNCNLTYGPPGDTLMLTSSQLGHISSHVVVLQGSTSVLEQSSLLERLAERCGQSAAMNWLQYFLSRTIFRSKKPYLVLILDENCLPSEIRLENVHAAVLLFEYRVFGLPTEVFSTDDAAGFRTVISLPADRSVAARIAIDAVLERNAQVVLLSYDNAERQPAKLRFTDRHEILWSQRTRQVAKALDLSETFEATLATLGKSTRFNLGYYRRRLSEQIPLEFVPDASGMLTEAELEAVNANSLNPIPSSEFKLQYQSADLPGGFVLGLRSLEGKWLSLIGGWRQGGVTVLHWQMNASGYEKLSIGTAVRSYFLEHEIELGTKTLLFYGGTPHSIQNSFVQEEVTDLIVQRRSWPAVGLRLLATLLAAPHWYSPRPNFLARALCNDDLQWHSSGESAKQEIQSRAFGAAVRLRDRVLTGLK